jgi:2-hydroxychromene-2-carboxylate isomerase
MVPRVDFFYDFSCPYAYLAHTEVETLCARAGAELVWKPFLLGGVFKAIGSAGPAMPPSKARHNLLDMYRWADHIGVPLRMPAGHPNRTVLALRAALSAGTELARASKALYRAYWVDALDISDASVVRAALDAVGLDGAALLARAELPEIKDELRTRTDEAIAHGIFGAPTFIVRTAHAPDGDLFWGQDRMMFVGKALGGWRAPAPGAGL